VRVEINQRSFEMLRLVQLPIRTWLTAKNQLDRLKTEPIRVLVEVFLSGYYKTCGNCQLLLLHSNEVLSHAVDKQDTMLKQAKIAYSTGWYLLREGENVAVERVRSIAVEAWEEMLGLDGIAKR
jgi:hypothetical protein